MTRQELIEKWGLEDTTNISPPEGWLDVLDTLCEKLSQVPGWSFSYIVTIKEKFGGLRVYYVIPVGADISVKDDVDPLIEIAESAVVNICEKCGSADQVKKDLLAGWVHTLCKQHRG